MNTVTLNMYASMSYPGINQAEYGMHIRVVAPQECVSICSTRRFVTNPTPLCVEAAISWRLCVRACLRASLLSSVCSSL